MQIDIFTLCDSSHVYEGKMVVVGALSNLASAQLPFAVPQLSLAVRLSYDDNDAEPKTFTLSILKPDGSVLAGPFSNQIDLTNKTPGMANVNLNVNLNNIPFNAFGEYKAILEVNTSKYIYSFTVVQLTDNNQ